MWSKYVTRRLAVQVAQAWNFGWGEAMKEVYGVSVNDTLVIRDAKKTDYYVDQEEHERYVAGLYELLENKKFLESFHGDAQAVLETILAKTQEKFSTGFHSLSRDELLALYRDFVLPNQTQFYIRMWTVFNIGEPLANTVEKQLRALVPEEQVTPYLLMFSTPLEPNDVLNERISLLNIANEKGTLSETELEKRLEAHTDRFKHIPMFDFDHEPYSIEHFRNALAEVEEPKEELSKIEAQFKEHAQEFEKALAQLQPSKELTLLLQFLKENVFLRDYRDMIRQRLNLQLRDFYTAISQYLGLSVQQVATLTNDEIAEYLESGELFPKEKMMQREEAYLLIQRGAHVQIYSGAEALEKAAQEPGVGITSDHAIQEVRGVVGSRGKATGRAAIVYTNKDLAKVGQGDILVATMTRQDFVPAMRRAAAVVTDEGSVTAHAAIIARELGIPCIVATKTGTQTFKDGDLLEVDAMSGTVRILNRAGGGEAG